MSQPSKSLRDLQQLKLEISDLSNDVQKIANALNAPLC